MSRSTGTSSSTSTSSIHQCNNELSSFYAAFRADDTLIDIIPAFDYHPPKSNHNKNNKSNDDDRSNSFQSTLSSTSIFGSSSPIKAGLIYPVPIWMAMLLQQRSFATIVYPHWYNMNNLKYILAFEKSHTSLFITTTTTTNDDTHTTSQSRPNISSRDSDDDDDVDDVDHHKNDNDYFLPSNYYELAQRFATSVSTTATTTLTNHSSSNQNMDVVTLLIQDIYDIRMDKLRQQFQSLLDGTTHPRNTTTTNNMRSLKMTDLIVNVTGIGTHELAHIQSYVIQAMNDLYSLES